MDRICKIKWYWNYINWWYKSKYSSSPKYILKSEKKSGNDGLKAVFELAPVLLDFYDSRGKLGTISVTSRTVIISATYKKGDKRDIENYRPHF